MGFLDDVVDSIPVIGGTTPNQTVEAGKVRIYRKCKFLPQLTPGSLPTNASDSFKDMGPGMYTGKELGKVAGIKPSKGMIVKVFKTPDYSGDSLTISDDSMTCLKKDKDWNEQVKSIEIKAVEGFGMPNLLNIGLLDVVIMVLLLVVAILLYKKY